MADLTGVDIALVLDKIRPKAAWRNPLSYELLAATWEDTAQTCPTADEIESAWAQIKTDNAVAQLDAEYGVKIAALATDYATAQMADAYFGTSTAAAILADYEAAVTEYSAALEAIE